MLPHRSHRRALLAPLTRALAWSLLPATVGCGEATFGGSPNAPALRKQATGEVDKAPERRDSDAVVETNTGTRGPDYDAGAASPGAGPGGGSHPEDGAGGAVPPGARAPVPPGPLPGTRPLPVVTVPRPTTPTQVKDACTGTRTRKLFSLEFPATKGVAGSICTWSAPPVIGDVQQSDHIRGFHRQTASVDLPDNALVCESNLRTKDSTLWEYDDEVVLTLNSVVVTTSQDNLLFEDPAGRRVPRLMAEHGGYVWDWKRVFESNLFNHGSTYDSIYCLGAGVGEECRLPLTQREGAVKLSLGTDAVSALSLKALRDKKLEYALTVVGDNDPLLDCKHSGITIQGELEYVVVQ